MFKNWMLMLSCLFVAQHMAVLKSAELLTNVLYHQGMLADQVICLFSEAPSCIYEPELSWRRNSSVREKYSRADFLIPFMSMSTDAKKELDILSSTKNNHHSFRCEAITKPTKGLRLQLTFNPEEILCQYQTSNNIMGKQALIFNFYDKNTVDRAASEFSTLRWAKNTIHQPRIVIDQKTDQNFIANKLADQLKKRGCEAVLICREQMALSDTIRINYANMVAHADLLITIACKQASEQKARCSVIIADPAKSQVKQEWASPAEAEQLERICSHRHNLSLQCAKLVHSNLGTNKEPIKLVTTNQMLIAAQLPAIALEIMSQKDSDQKELIKNICNGIMSYFKQKGFANHQLPSQ